MDLERNEEIKKLWSEGVSSSLIVSRLQERFPTLTRSAVMGIISRANLPKRVTRIHKPHFVPRPTPESIKKMLETRKAKRLKRLNEEEREKELQEELKAKAAEKMQKRRCRMPDMPKSYYRDLLRQAVENTK